MTPSKLKMLSHAFRHFRCPGHNFRALVPKNDQTVKHVEHYRIHDCNSDARFDALALRLLPCLVRGITSCYYFSFARQK